MLTDLWNASKWGPMVQFAFTATTVHRGRINLPPTLKRALYSIRATVPVRFKQGGASTTIGADAIYIMANCPFPMIVDADEDNCYFAIQGVTNSGTFEVSMVSDTIDFTITDRTIPVANFTGTPLIGADPLTVTFTDTSVGNPTSWAWDFGDGTTSTLQNPTHAFSGVGTYTVTLVATNAYGSDSEVKTAYIDVGVAPVADFSGTPLTGTIPLSVAFTDTSTGTPTSWAWDFGDGNTDTVQNPSNSYAAAGTFDVSLTATNAYGNNTKVASGYVTASAALTQLAIFDTASNYESYNFTTAVVTDTAIAVTSNANANAGFGDATNGYFWHWADTALDIINYAAVTRSSGGTMLRNGNNAAISAAGNTTVAILDDYRTGGHTDKFTYATQTAAAAAGSLTKYLAYGAGFSVAAAGYFLGGQYDDNNPPTTYINYTTRSQKYTFATDVVSATAGTFHAFRAGAASGNTTVAILLEGDYSLDGTSAVGDYSDQTEKFTIATETYAAATALLSYFGYSPAQSNATKLVSGGRRSSVPKAFVTYIFATDTVATVTPGFTYNQWNNAAVGNSHGGLQ